MRKFKMLGVAAVMLVTAVQFAPLQPAESKSLRSMIDSAINSINGQRYGYGNFGYAGNGYGAYGYNGNLYSNYGYGNNYGYNPYIGNIGYDPYGNYIAPRRSNFAAVIRNYVGF